MHLALVTKQQQNLHTTYRQVVVAWIAAITLGNVLELQ